jgi:subtilase family serine protease
MATTRSASRKIAVITVKQGVDMVIGNPLRRLRAPLVCGSILLLAFAESATADPVSAMTPLLRLGSQESLVAMPDAVAPQYGLFTCQVGVGEGACYDPYQMRKAYQVDSLIAASFDGTGQTIVIVDAFQNPNLVAQVGHFNTFYGLPAVQLTQVAPDGLTPFVTGDPNMTGWAEEISLDVEWAHAIAPGARIVLVLAKSNSDADLLSALKYAVDNSLGNVVSMSFGENERCLDAATNKAYHRIFANATKKNIGLFASSGDQGAALPTCDGTSWVKAVSSPANDPLVTGVGGTELTAAKYCLALLGCDPNSNPAAGTYQSEIAWNEGLPFGDFGDIFGLGTLASGGGFSVVSDQPRYQRDTARGRDEQRGVPDVAYNAAVEHGVLTYLSIPGIPAGFYRFGGTSAGAPQWAAVAAIANHKAGHPLGFLNPTIYKIAREYSDYSKSFHDITVGNNSSLQFDASGKSVTIIGYKAGPRWDPVTGLGSPIAAGLVDLLIRFSSSENEKEADNIAEPKTHSDSNSKDNERRFRPH